MKGDKITAPLPHYRADAPAEITGEIIFENKYFITVKTTKGYTETIYKKRGGKDMKKVDTPAEAKIREEIKAKGMEGLISPATIETVSKEQLEGFVANGMNNKKITKELGVSESAMCHLMKFYGIKNQNNRANIKVEDVPVVPVKEVEKWQETLNAEPEWMEELINPPILQAKDRAKAISILVAGVSDYLHQLGDVEVEVSVMVRKC